MCSLFLMYSHSFERIYTKFGMWHPYALLMVVGEVSKRHSSSRCACRLSLQAHPVCTIHTPLQMIGELYWEIQKYQAECRRREVLLIENHRHENQAPFEQGVTEHHRREGAAVV